MKFKYTLAALAATTVVASSATIATNTNEANNGGNGYFGFATSLDSPAVSVSSTLPSTFDLGSIELTGRDSGGTYSSMKIAIYTYDADGTVGDFVGLSDVQILGDGASATFSFSGVSLDSASTYQYLFVSDTTVAGDLSDGQQSSYQAAAASSSLSMSQNDSLPGGSGTYKNDSQNSWEGTFLPEFTFTEATTVPEPSSTALLGLGGLSLILRRRR